MKREFKRGGSEKGWGCDCPRHRITGCVQKADCWYLQLMRHLAAGGGGGCKFGPTGHVNRPCKHTQTRARTQIQITTRPQSRRSRGSVSLIH